MDVREKYVMQKVNRKEKSICPNCIHHNLCIAENNQPCFECNRFIDAHGVTVQEWISVSDMLPEECGFYICFFQSPYGNGCWRVGQCHWNEESWVRIGAVPPHVIVTHWMPLPQPPKGE